MTWQSVLSCIGQSVQDHSLTSVKAAVAESNFVTQRVHFVCRRSQKQFLSQVKHKTFKWVVVAPYAALHIQGENNDRQVNLVCAYCDRVGCHVLWL